MHLQFRKKHLFHLLETFSKQKLPLDAFIKNYFRQNKSLGSHDRKYLSETIFGIIRWKGLIDFLCQDNPSWKDRVECFETLSQEKYLNNSQIPLHARVSFPKEYFQYLTQELGEEKATLFCLESNQPAPITIRVNSLKTSREALWNLWKDTIPCSLGTNSHLAIQFPKRMNFFTFPEFKQGLFEVQDEGSQLVALQVKSSPGDFVLDYCSGAGGKALAIAPAMKSQGTLYLHDIRERALLEAKKRVERAGIEGAEILFFDDPKKNTLLGKMNWVLVDAPCSGSGTLRRSPDLKWHFDAKNLSKLIEEQRSIFQTALDFVKVGGFIVYATCSILPAENNLQTEYFLKNFHVKQVAPSFQSFPRKGCMDGFYAVTFQKYAP